MMKGTNKFLFNHETMKEALKYWMRNTLVRAGEVFEVVDITPRGTPDNLNGEFCVTIQVPEEETEDDPK